MLGKYVRLVKSLDAYREAARAHGCLAAGAEARIQAEAVNVQDRVHLAHLVHAPWIPRPPGRLRSPARDRLTLPRRAHAARYGDVVFFRIAGAPFAVLNHPDHVRDVLVTRHRLFHKGVGLERARMLLGDGLLTSEDDRHVRQRRLIQPAFHRERIAGLRRHDGSTTRGGEAIAGSTARLIDVAREMGAITLAIAGKTLFDADVEQDASHVGEALTAALTSFNLALLPFGDRLVRLPIPAARRFRRARAGLDATIYRLIARAAGESARPDATCSRCSSRHAMTTATAAA